MPGPFQSLARFWQELKRRNVVRRNAVYAGAAFVILELVSIIQEPLRLPEWTLPVVIIFLSIGFIVSIVISWIYDINPEGGLEKTKSVNKVEIEDKPTVSSTWKIASYLSFVVIIALIILNIIPKNNRSEEISILDKSIAVLPFIYLSDEPDKQYLADGAMDEILLNLSKIEDLRVLARTSVEQFRETEKTATEICQELNVSYLLEGSFLKNGDQVRLIVQLIESGIEGHAWAKKYDRSWGDIFKVQSEVAQSVANELKAIITPDEKQLIEKTPTKNLAAYDFYQRGVEEFRNGEIEKAEDLYYKALEYDSTFAQAYAGLARVYWSESDDFSEPYLDSVLIQADIALSFDNQLADAYTIRGEYFLRIHKLNQAEEEFDKAIRFNPNDYLAYVGKGQAAGERRDYVNRINYNLKAASLYRGPGLPDLLRRVGYSFRLAGFPDESNYYAQEALKLDGDSVEFYSNITQAELAFGNYEKAIEFGLKGYYIDSLNLTILNHLGRNYLYLSQYEESLRYFEKYIERSKTLEISFLNRAYNIGFVYRQNGQDREAEYYLGEHKKFWEEGIRLNHWMAQNLRAYIELSAVYAIKGEKQKAIENLKIFNQRKAINLGRVNELKTSPVFDNMRDEPEFQQILMELEAKYLKEHERVRSWLEENDKI